ncbi:hypothetical protein RO3G_01080 [Rhizopus delemar RA 99-880]|uniref:Uncharacterized protein n=1 Tax=Rhizopus delemar (strain RA 99-880 / ATCC MYA-4621 / FGSC 9543 / NRRL 43880) TaxID=246409 RepID=I1BJJ6_RHIO9|nr:hypothetical protein RO3G_01080 [Rhizopus delemar RA 99-880]|eukprot:EIE76376.1 hypothetical protein RO3G_01080 [Rhizopus delemar RA 99-880]
MLQTSLPRNHMLPRSISSSSRSTRVIEELQDNLENIQKELENTKIQLRADIQEVMQVLESKQQLLDDTKKIYALNESKVKQLKDEAMAARKELEDLKRREHLIEKERRALQTMKEKMVQQNDTLQQSIRKQQAEFDRELQAQEELLQSIGQEIERLRSLNVTEIVKEKMEHQAKERKRLVKEMKQVEEALDLNTRAFIQQVKKELTEFMNQVTDDSDLTEQVDQCLDAVNGLSVKIK